MSSRIRWIALDSPLEVLDADPQSLAGALERENRPRRYSM